LGLKLHELTVNLLYKGNIKALENNLLNRKIATYLKDLLLMEKLSVKKDLL